MAEIHRLNDFIIAQLARQLYETVIALRPTLPGDITLGMRAPWRTDIWLEAAEAARQVLSRDLSLAEALRPVPFPEFRTNYPGSGPDTSLISRVPQ